jgi:hypothetical protein
MNVRPLLRWVLRLPPPKVTREQALDIARRECLRRGWRVADEETSGPRDVREKLRCYCVTTPLAGRNISFIIVDNQDGHVLKSQVLGTDGGPGGGEEPGAGAGVPAPIGTGPRSRAASNAEPVPSREAGTHE